jgi:putative membrane protein
MASYLFLFKTLHIIGFVAWFAGLFYLGRMFVYHREAMMEEDPKKSILIEQFHTMQMRVYRIICNPAMMITWTFGLLMLVAYGTGWLKLNPWMHAKLLLVVLLTLYHLYCKLIILKLHEKTFVMSSFKFRLFNEIPTLFLVSIVLLAVYRNGLNYGVAALYLLAFALVLTIFTKIYKFLRERKLPQNENP